MIAAELGKPLDFGRAFEENVGVISLRTAFLCLAAVLAGLAQQPGPALSVDANAGRHEISPDITASIFIGIWGAATLRRMRRSRRRRLSISAPPGGAGAETAPAPITGSTTWTTSMPTGFTRC